jgi:hypothetical protein
MASSEEVRLIIKAATEEAVKNIEKLNGSLGDTEKTGGKLTTGLGKLKSGWLAMAAAVATAAVAVNKMTKDASDLNESQNKLNEVFKSSASAHATATAGIKELNNAYAMSRNEATALTSSIGALLIPMGYLPDEAAKASVDVVKLAADLGSFNNLPTEETLNAIRSALVGEYEPMRRLGVVLNETVVKQEAANIGFKVGTGVLDGNAKSHAALSLIMKNTVQAQDDMIKTADGYANTSKRAQAAAEDMSAALGSILLPAMTAIQSALASAFQFIGQLSDGWKTAIVTIGIAAIAIGVLTKVVMAFGISLSAAIWPITLIVAAIVAAIAIVKNWETVVWALKVAWEAVKFGFEVVVQSLKVGMAAINVAMSKAVEFIATPFVNAINIVITGLNKLPGVHLEKMNNIFAQQTEHDQLMLEQELAKLASLEMADVEHKTKKEEQESAHQGKMNEIKNGGAIVETAQIDAKLKAQIALEQAYYATFKGITITSEQAMKNIKINNELEAMKQHDEALKERLQKDIEYKQRAAQIDTELLDLKLRNRGLDTKSFGNFWSFALGALDQGSKTQFKVWKAMSVANAMVATYQAAINAYNALAGIPIVGPVLGAAAAATAAGFGLLQINKIKNTQFQGAEEGALIRGTPGSSGTLVRAGENNKDEAIIPLEDSGVMGKMGTTVNIYNETAIMDDDYSQSIAIKIDNALYKLKQSGMSKSL